MKPIIIKPIIIKPANMKPAIILTVLLATMFLFVSCNSTTKVEEEKTGINTESIGYKKISPEEAKARLEKENGIILLDVRSPEEHAEKHIPNSILIPVNDIEKEAPATITDKDAIIIVYCKSGRRSATASEALVRLGYKNVYNLGGINDWPYETT